MGKPRIRKGRITKNLNHNDLKVKYVLVIYEEQRDWNLYKAHESCTYFTCPIIKC